MLFNIVKVEYNPDTNAVKQVRVGTDLSEATTGKYLERHKDLPLYAYVSKTCIGGVAIGGKHSIPSLKTLGYDEEYAKVSALPHMRDERYLRMLSEAILGSNNYTEWIDHTQDKAGDVVAKDDAILTKDYANWLERMYQRRYGNGNDSLGDLVAKDCSDSGL